MRTQKPRFKVEIYHDVVPYLAGISLKEFFLDDERLIRAWKVATQWTLDTFQGRLPPRTPTAAPNSYGHLICLGAPLQYSDQAEPNIRPVTNSLEEGIRLLTEAQGMDFTACPIFRQYARTSARVREVFPESPVFSGLGVEGPITSAALYLGDTFYIEAIENPERVRHFLQLMTDSIVSCRRQINAFCGLPEVDPQGTGLADDLASMLPPHLWDNLVVPFWRQYFEGGTSGPRHFLHCEAMVPAQLKFLKPAGVTFYQPSVSPKLTLEDMRTLDIPFDWLLYAFHITGMTDDEIAAWVDKAIQAGAENIRTQFGEYTVREGKIDRIQAFLDVKERYTQS